MIDPKLVTLSKVAQTGSFTKAAEELSLSQPAVSQHIHQLEIEMGVTLFRKVGKQFVLTPEGERALEFARRIQSLYADFDASVRNERGNITRLKVGITHTAESGRVTEALASYCSQNGKANIMIITDTINNLYNKLKTFEIDLAVAEGTVPDPEIHSVLLDTDYLVLMMANDHPLAGKSMVTVEELKKERMILRLPNSGARELFVSGLEGRGLSLDDFNVILEVDSIATIKDLVLRGYGVSILAQSACLDELKKGRLTALPVENLSMSREVNILYHQTFRNMDALREIVRLYNRMARKGIA